MSYSLFAKSSPEDVVSDPYPYLVVHDALDEDLYEDMSSAFPQKIMLSTKKAQKYKKGDYNNRRLNHNYHMCMSEKNLSGAWKKFIKHQSSRQFYDDFIDFFRPHIEKIYPKFFTQIKNVGRYSDDRTKDMSFCLEANISANTPVTKHSSVRGAHLDSPYALYAGLFYMRPDNDKAEGGDLNIYSATKDQIQIYDKSEVRDSNLKVAATVPYKKNTFVILMNSIVSVHGVSPRPINPHVRRFVNVFGRAKNPLFDVGKYR